MNLKFIYTLLGICLCFQAVGQDREIYWLHGSGGESALFNGSAASWNVYQARYDVRSEIVNSRRITYTSNAGVNTGALTARVALNAAAPAAPPAPTSNIAWAHSFGGLTIREMERLGISGDVGGIITAGSPHFGAKMATSFQDGSALAYLAEGCDEVVVDPLASIGVIGPFPANIASILTIAAGEKLCEEGLSSLLEQNSIFTGSATITDLRPNSAALNTLNGTSINKPMINIFGSESSPVHWRWFNNLISVDNPIISTENRPAFLPLNGTADGSNSLQAEMAGLEDFERDVANIAGSLGIAFLFNPSTWTLAGASFNASNQFTQGANWLQNSEANWNELIGANESFEQVEIITGSIMSEDCAQGVAENGWGWYYGTLTCEEQNACWLPNEVTTLIPVMGVSDGLVHQLTAQIPGACVLSNVGGGLGGVNHQELVNHPAMTAVYDNILDANYSTSSTCTESLKSFFETEL